MVKLAHALSQNFHFDPIAIVTTNFGGGLHKKFIIELFAAIKFLIIFVNVLTLHVSIAEKS